jgi:hypothetical protein
VTSDRATRGSEETTLHPDEHSVLELIAARLRAAEPHLAAMFSIFNRLTVEEGDPPDEDRIRPAGRPGAAGSARGAHRELVSSLRVLVIPAALLMMLVVVFTVILSGGGCAPLSRASIFAYHTAKVTACEQAQAKKAIVSSRR